MVRRLLTILGLTALWLIASYVLFRRYPNNYRYPNFYAEDGPVFGRNLAQHGLLHAMGTTFNGYFIAGLYLIEQLANALNRIIGGGELVNLPRSLSLLSYGFLGFCVGLPTLLLRNYVRPATLCIATLLLLFVPLLGADYIVLGTIGSLKFAFVFVAFVFLIYRHLIPANDRKILLVDLAILICAYTNITVYFLMPFALLRYWPKVKAKDRWQQLWQDRSFRWLVLLGLAMLPQLYIIKRDGIPALPGYLDSTYQTHSTVELFIGRSYLYSFMFAVYRHLNDLRAVVIMLVLSAVAWWRGGRYRAVLLFGIYATFITTGSFVLKRTGISAFYHGYHGGGFDQFFYAQNWIFDLAMALAGGELVARLKPNWLRPAAYIAASLIIIFGFAPRASSFGRTNFMSTKVGTIYQEAQRDCRSPNTEFDLHIYPEKPLDYDHVSRQQLCTKSIQSH